MESVKFGGHDFGIKCGEHQDAYNANPSPLQLPERAESTGQ
jgi:hypothetical protein